MKFLLKNTKGTIVHFGIFENVSEATISYLCKAEGPIKHINFGKTLFNNIVVIKRTLIECEFINCLAVGTRFELCTFIDCDFSLICFANVVFERCLFINCNFSYASITSCHIKSCSFSGPASKFYFTSFTGSALEDVTIRSSLVGDITKNSKFYSCNLSDAILRNVDIDNGLTNINLGKVAGISNCKFEDITVNTTPIFLTAPGFGPMVILIEGILYHRKIYTPDDFSHVFSGVGFANEVVSLAKSYSAYCQNQKGSL